MFYFENEIKAALEIAPEITDIRSIVLPGNEVPSTLYVQTAEKLGQLMIELARILGGTPDESWINNVVRHEGQHHDAWKLIGVQSTWFGLQIFKNSQGISYGIATLPFLRVATYEKSPLEIASAAAYPVDPSIFDIEHVRSYGFDGVEEVAEKAIQNNMQGFKRIPVPLSYKSMDRRTAPRVYPVVSSPYLGWD